MLLLVLSLDLSKYSIDLPLLLIIINSEFLWVNYFICIIKNMLSKRNILVIHY